MKLKALTAAAVAALALALPSVARTTVYTGTVDPTTGDAVKVISSSTAFYPYVHDGYEDTASFGVRMTDPDDDCYNSQYAPRYSANIWNTATGRTIRILTWTDWYDDTVGSGGSAHIFKWDGKNAAGKRVKVGTHYRTTVKVTVAACDDGTGTGSTVDVSSKDSAGFTMTTATGWKSEKKTKTKRGRYTYAHSGCNSRADGWSWWLDSSFGCHDSATYRFAVPTSGTNVSGGISAPYKQGPFGVSRSRSGGYVYEKVSAAQGSYGDVESAHVSYYVKVRI
jgi:hypothetical protein